MFMDSMIARIMATNELKYKLNIVVYKTWLQKHSGK